MNIHITHIPSIDLPIHALFQEQVNRNPSRFAVKTTHKAFTYAELSLIVDKVAAQILFQKLEKESIIAVCMDRTPEMIGTLLGIMKAGCAYLPIDPAFPDPRKKMLAEEAQSPLIITQTNYASAFTGLASKTIIPNHIKDYLDSATVEWPNVDIGQLCYVLFTSGSTGKPKGVMIEHRSVVNYLLSYNAIAPLQNMPNGTSICPYVFDVSVWEFFSVLCFGGTLHLLETQSILDINGFAKYLSENQINSTYLAPGILNDLVATFETDKRLKLPDRILVGVEPIQQSTLQRYLDLQPKMQIINAYGPTEATISCTFYAFTNAQDPQKRTPIGKAIEGYRIYIVNEQNQQVAVGETGEILIGGIGLARGYLNDNNLTTQKFIPNPFTSTQGERLYKTGDLAYYLPDGNLMYDTRLDYQVKIRGYRIELGEVETIMLQSGMLKECVATAREADNGIKYLVLYYTRIQTELFTEQALRRYAELHLPIYMIPSVFVELQQIPRNQSGKVDRKLLPATTQPSPSPLMMELSNHQEVVMQLWQEVLGSDAIGLDANFFSIGGNSINAAQVVARLNRKLNSNYGLEVVFSYPSVFELANFLESNKQTVFEQPTIQINTNQQVFRLSYNQQRPYILERFRGANSLYNIPMVLQLQGKVNFKALEIALSNIVAKHQIYRTTYGEVNGEPAQIIHPFNGFSIAIQKVQVEQTTNEKLIRDVIATECSTPFNLSTGPMLRALLVELSEHEHILVLNVHHIASDGWSMGLLLEELSVGYSSACRNELALSTTEITQYASFSMWQRQVLATTQAEERLAKAVQWFEGMPSFLNIPTNYQRPAEFSYRGASFYFNFDEELSENIAHLAKATASSNFMVLMAAFGVLLKEYSRQETFLVGTMAANRVLQEFESAHGFFTNTVLIKHDLEGNPNFMQLIDRTKIAASHALQFQDIPFEQVLEKINPPRNLSYNPLYQVMLIYQNMPIDNLKLEGLVANELEIDRTSSKIDLTLTFDLIKGRLRGLVEYNPDLFNEGSMRAMASHLQLILDKVTSHPDIKLSDINILTHNESLNILKWSVSPQQAVEEKKLSELLNDAFKRHSNLQAISQGHTSFTYGDMNRQVKRLAEYISSLQLPINSPIGIIATRVPSTVTAMLACIRSMHPFVPLDSANPESRLQEIITEAGITHILASRHSEHQIMLKTGTTELTQIEDITYNQAYDLKEVTSFSPSPELPAYIIFTSGSTGKPKGVVVSRGSLANFIQASIHNFNMVQGDRVLQFASLTFDTALEEIFPCFCSGGTLVLRNDDMIASHTLFLEKIRKAEISILDLPTAYWNQLIITMEHQNLRFHDNLRLIIIGGEAVGLEYIKIFNKLNPRHIKLVNTYGPTETTVVATSYKFDSNIEPSWVPIGKPILNATVFVVNKNLRLVPPGIPGELLIGGKGLALGYINHPELTNEKFINLDLTGKGAQRFYRTGDLVKYNPDGDLIFLGRTDFQLKIRGFRVEPGEIESHLLSLPDITQAVVMIRDDRPGISLLTAYLVTSQNRYNTKYYKDRLRMLVPDYMIPQVFVVLDQLPINRQGKIDRTLLPMPDFNAILTDKEFIEPNTPLQLKLALIWKDILQLERIGINDHFFELGGNSIKATQLISRVNALTKGEFPFKVLFTYPTIEAMERYILSKDFKRKQKAAEITKHPQGIIIPASSTQKRIWFLHQLEGSSVAYNIPMAYSIQGDVDLGVLNNAIDEVLLRHSILRSCIKPINNEPTIHIEPSVKAHIELIDLRNFQPEDKKAELALLSKNFALHVFNLSMVPLFKFSLIRLEAKESLLLLNFHHLVLDNWSAGLFLKELSLIYDALLHHQKILLSPPKLQYPDYVVWQQGLLNSEHVKAQAEYWKETLSGAPEILQLPLDHGRKMVQTFNGAEVRQTLDANITQQIKDFSLSQGVSLYATLLSAFSAVLYRYSNQNDIIIGCPVANRNHEDTEDIMGVFINNLPLRIQIPERISFKAYCKLVNKLLLEAFENQDLPLDKIIENLNIKRNINISPLFQVMFNLLNAHNQNLALSGCEVHYIDPGRFVSKLDLSLIMMETKGVLHAVFEYNSDLFKYKTIRSFASHFNSFLQAVFNNPDTYIDKVELLSQHEKLKLFSGINQTTKVWPAGHLTDILVLNAVRYANNIAYQTDTSQISYEHLNKKTSTLAAHLQRRGLKPKQLAGVMLHRTVNLPVALLAILKAGGAYVPLDPIYPKERIAQIVQDAGISLFITENALIDHLPSDEAELINIDDAANFRPLSFIKPEIEADDAAYVIFTSGSTGRPKGVQISHKSLMNFLWSMREEPGIGTNDRLLAVTTISFDIAGLEMFLPLLCGASVVIASAEEAMDADMLVNKIEKEKITIMQATPITWRMIMLTNWNGALNLKALCGGEALQQDLANQLVAHCKEVWNMYGPTETTIWSTLQPVHHHEIPEGYEAIGKPIANTSVYVLDKNLSPVPIGVPGELYIGGQGVALGYYNRNDLTSERFIPNPFVSHNEKMYRTGDYVKLSSTGVLEYLSRIDNQVKIRGFRIELGEIESVISRFAGVIQNVVLVREDTPHSKRIVAYIIPEKETSIQRTELRNFLMQQLPDYMIPAVFVFVDSFPLTPNGKIDRKNFPIPDSSSDTSFAEFVEPQDETQKMLAGIWKDLLKRDKISTNDDFFELGGHSLLAVSMMGRIENETRKRIPLATLFTHSKLADLAKIIDKQQNANDWRSLVHIKPFGNLIPLFLIHGAGLNVMLYNTLINSLSIDQPVFGLQAKGLNGIDKPLETIEEIAAHYISEIKTEYPVGPYAFAGFSLGGIIAFEVAKQLQAAGDEVAFVGMLDTIAYTSDKHLSKFQQKLRRSKFIVNQILFNIGAFINEPQHNKSKLFLWKLSSLKRKVKSLIYRMRASHAYATGDKDKLPTYLHNVHEINNKAGENYVLKPSNVAIELFKAAHQTFYIEDKHTYGWEKYALNGITVHLVPGEHSTLFWPPNDVQFAHTLQKRLEEVNTAYQLKIIKQNSL